MPDSNGDHTAPGGYPLGVRPSPPDEQDRRYSLYQRVLSADELPEEYICPDLGPVHDQGAVQSCVAEALALSRHFCESRELGWPFYASVQDIYSDRGPYDYKGPGMVPREALAKLLKRGVAPEAMWPGRVEYGKEVWPADREALAAASLPHRIESYLRVEHEFILILKSAIYTLGPVLYCVPVHDNFIPDSRGIIPLPAGTLRGGHGMALGGWTRDYLWYVRNSWGLKWGLNGDCYFPWSWPAWEVWSVTDAETPKPKTSRTVRIVDGDFRIWVDGVPTTVDRAPRIMDGRFLAVVRHVAEAFGAEVRWDWLPASDPENPGKVYAEFELPLVLPIGKQSMVLRLPGWLENVVRRVCRWTR